MCLIFPYKPLRMVEHAAVNRSVDSSSLPGAATKSTKSELFILRWIVRILLSFAAQIAGKSVKKQEIRHHCLISCFFVSYYVWSCCVACAARRLFHSSKSLRPSSVAIEYYMRSILTFCLMTSNGKLSYLMKITL